MYGIIKWLLAIAVVGLTAALTLIILGTLQAQTYVQHEATRQITTAIQVGLKSLSFSISLALTALTLFERNKH
jgi:hypothetical protein